MISLCVLPINQYLRVRRSFIRREILALEGRGYEISPIAVRR